MAQKLTKPWGPHPAGTLVTTDREEAQELGATRVNAQRLQLLSEGGFLSPAPTTVPTLKSTPATSPPAAATSPVSIVPPHVFSSPAPAEEEKEA